MPVPGGPAGVCRARAPDTRRGAPPPEETTGLELARLRYRISGLPEHHRMLKSFIRKIEDRTDPVCPPEAPRVMVTGCPILKDCMAYLECKVRESLAPGNHTLYLGEVVDARSFSDGTPFSSLDYSGMYLGKE